MILLDTHVLIWLLSDAAKLSRRARAAIEQARKEARGLAVSDISLLEITSLASKGRITLGITLGALLEAIESRFAVMPITSRACVRSLELPASYPNDPADRIIGATALVEGLPLITADRNIRRSRAIRAIW